MQGPPVGEVEPETLVHSGAEGVDERRLVLDALLAVGRVRCADLRRAAGAPLAASRSLASCRSCWSHSVCEGVRVDETSSKTLSSFTEQHQHHRLMVARPRGRGRRRGWCQSPQRRVGRLQLGQRRNPQDKVRSMSAASRNRGVPILRWSLRGTIRCRLTCNSIDKVKEMVDLAFCSTRRNASDDVASERVWSGSFVEELQRTMPLYITAVVTHPPRDKQRVPRRVPSEMCILHECLDLPAGSRGSAGAAGAGIQGLTPPPGATPDGWWNRCAPVCPSVEPSGDVTMSMAHRWISTPFNAASICPRILESYTMHTIP